MIVYLDTCALNRLSDDQSQMRIHSEALAVERILGLIASNKARWLASSALQLELSRNPNPIKRADSLALLSFAWKVVPTSPAAFQRAHDLQTDGYSIFDALHLAICEENNADVLVTVDDRFLRRASLRPKSARPEVVNPIDWVQRR